jgi:hypothetical protein
MRSSLQRTLSAKRLFAGEQLMRNRPKCIEIGCCCGLFSEELLRRRVIYCASSNPHGHSLSAAARYAEIHQFQRAVCTEHQVAGLDVAVNDSVRVQALQSFRHLTEYRDEFFRGEAFGDL